MVTSLISASGAPVAAPQHLICLHCCSSFTAGSCSACCPPGPPGSPQQRVPACARLFGAVTAAGPCTCLCSTLCSSCQLSLPACPGPVRLLTLLTHPPHHPVWCHQQTWGWCSESCHPDYLWWCCKVWVPPSFLGDPPLVTGFQTELKPLTCTFWVHPVGPVSCPFCRPPSGIFLVCPGGGCGKQCQMLCWSLLNSICCSHYVDRNCYFVAGAQKGLARFVYCETALAFPNHLFHLALGKRDSNYIVLQPDTVIMGAPWMFS